MNGGGCLGKSPRPGGQEERGFQEGRGPCFWLLLGGVGAKREEEEKPVFGGGSPRSPDVGSWLGHT